MADKEAIVAAWFFLEAKGISLSSVTEVSGLEDETDMVEIQEVKDKGKVTITKVPGAAPVKSGKLTLKYPWVKDDPCYDWFVSAAKGEMDKARKDLTLSLFTVDDKKALMFNFKRAWVSSYDPGSFSAKSSDPISITLNIE